MPIAQDHDMIQAFSPGRADESFDVSVRPERAGRSWSAPDAHRLGLTPEKCLDFQRQNRRKPAVSQALESLDKISCRDKGSAANLGAEVDGGHIHGPWQLQADA